MRQKDLFYRHGNLMLMMLLFCSGCLPGIKPASQKLRADNDWKSVLEQQMPLLGHRNWILIVDKAFPLLNAPGIDVIYADEDLLTVLRYTLEKIDSSSHVRPIIYVDKELQYITQEQEAGINSYRDSIKQLVHSQILHAELHDSVFTMVKRTSELFKVLVIKTKGTRAYSSVYLQLDCAYWNGANEEQLRQTMQ